MRSKIVTIEDVTKIVGMTNYIQALNLDREKLIYDTYESFGNKIKVHFHYEELPITVLINKEYRMMDMIQMNLCRKQSSFRMRRGICQARVRCSLSGKHVFFSLGFMEHALKNPDHAYCMETEAERKY